MIATINGVTVMGTPQEILDFYNMTMNVYRDPKPAPLPVPNQTDVWQWPLKTNSPNRKGIAYCGNGGE